MFSLLFALCASAYETDQLTERHLPLADMIEPANVEADRLIALAVARTNKRLQCDASRMQTGKVLSKEIHRATSKRQRVPERGFFRSPGYSVYARWMETAPGLERRQFLKPRNDIYSSLTLWHSFILTIAGTNSTFNLGGVLMGSDKPDHFFDLGRRYLKRSRWGVYPLRGIRWGTATERSFYGMLTSKTFSYADLAANSSGYAFYNRLLTEDSEVIVGDDGCVEIQRGFDWAQWVSWEWDEVLNPGVHTNLVQRGLSKHLEANRDAYCEAYEALGSDYNRRNHEVLLDSPYYADGGPPRRPDPYKLAKLCSSG